MISEYISQTFMYNIKDIKYDIIHDFKVSIPISETCLVELSGFESHALQVQVQEICYCDLSPSTTKPG